MSSSCPESTARIQIGLAIAAVITVLPAGSAAGADVYVQPKVEVRVESSSNRDMSPITDSDSDTVGGLADLSALIGVATPRGETSIRPRLKLQEYRNRGRAEPVEGFLDVRSQYAGPRSTFELLAKYSRRDSYTAELADAEFDDLDPDDPTTPETGNNRLGETRQRFEVRPEYLYQVTQRTSMGVELQYQGVRYSGEAALNRVDYDFGQALGFLGWSITPRRNFRIGAFASKYEAKNFLNETESYGGTLTLDQQWSETAGTSVEVLYERSDIVSETAPFDENQSGVGASVTSYWKGEVSEWRVVAGRTFTPTGRGGKSTADQLRIQYDRRLSERLRLRGAARYLSDESLNDSGRDGDRDYGRVELSLEWSMSPTWYLGGGYTYTYQDRKSDPDEADDHRFFLAVGYRGLGRQGR